MDAQADQALSANADIDGQYVATEDRPISTRVIDQVEEAENEDADEQAVID